MKIDFRSFLYICFVTLNFFQDTSGFNCKKVNSCKCSLDDGLVINLRPIGKKDGPYFKDLKDAGVGDFWSYNPCYSFTENACNDVAVCQLRNGAGISTGTQESVAFQYDPQNGLAMVYSETTDIKRTTYVYLNCEEGTEAELNPLGEIIADGNYYLYLNSKYACPRKDEDNDDDDEGLSGGSVLLIIFFVLVVVYFAGGFTFMMFVKKAEGPDRVPNLTFWTSLPGLVKDGVSFTINTAKSRTGYGEIK